MGFAAYSRHDPPHLFWGFGMFFRRLLDGQPGDKVTPAYFY